MLLSLIVHGGAWAIPDDQVDAHARGLLHGRKPAADPGTDDHEEVKLVG
jgi:hypothetical protein